jgi:hypothetical protein
MSRLPESRALASRSSACNWTGDASGLFAPRTMPKSKEHACLFQRRCTTPFSCNVSQSPNEPFNVNVSYSHEMLVMPFLSHALQQRIAQWHFSFRSGSTARGWSASPRLSSGLLFYSLYTPTDLSSAPVTTPLGRNGEVGLAWLSIPIKRSCLIFHCFFLSIALPLPHHELL